MILKKIARSGLKSRKRDTLLLNIVIILSFTFIVAAMIFQSSTKETKVQQRLSMYGEWNAAYLYANDVTKKELEGESEVSKVVSSKIIGQSDTLGMIGTSNDELVDMGNITFYKGRMPESDNEIALELNQLSNLGLEPELGQTISAVIDIVLFDREFTGYLNNLSNEDSILKDGYKTNRSHETPYEQVGDLLFIASTDIIYAFEPGTAAYPDDIRKNGFITKQKATIKKEFTLTGILDTYSDKWNIGKLSVPNTFITEEAGQQIVDAFYQTKILSTSDYKFEENLFMTIDSQSKIDELAIRYQNDIGGEALYSEQNSFNSDDITNTVDLGQDITEEVDSTGETTLSSKFRRNTFAYPNTNDSAEDMLTYLILGVIFLATTCAVFQIFLTQMKRRTKKIVLLKSIGSTNGQIVKIILWEGLYLLRNGLIIGGIAGVVLSYASIKIMNVLNHDSILFYPSYFLILLGIICGCVSLFLGMFIPMTLALRVPLTGMMQKPPKHKKTNKKKRDVKLQLNRKQSYSRISYDYFLQNKGKTLLPFALSSLIIVIVLVSLLLGFFSFDTYIDTVIKGNRPDYKVEAIYGDMKSKIPVKTAEIASFDGVKDINSYKYGVNTILWFDGMNDSSIIQGFYDMLPDGYLSEHTTKTNDILMEQEEWVKNGLFTKLYGIDSSTELYQDFINTISVGSIDKETFDSGEEVILILPMYLKLNEEKNTKFDPYKILPITTFDNRMSTLYDESNQYRFTLDSAYASTANYIQDIKVGDSIHLSADEEKIVKDSRVIKYTSKEVKVGAIIYSMDQTGIWPFTEDILPYTVIGSYQMVDLIYPASRFGLFNNTTYDMMNMVSNLYPTKFGKTVWYIYSDTDEGEVLDSKILAYANTGGHKFYNYRESNESLKKDALSGAMIIGLLGLTSALITLIILYNTLVSKIEQEQTRIGILQSIGITEKEFKRHYLSVGLLQGVIGVVIANFLAFIIVGISTANNMVDVTINISTIFSSMVTNTLYLYPWKVHIIISIGFIIFITLLNYRSSKRIVRNHPIENIRSLNR